MKITLDIPDAMFHRLLDDVPLPDMALVEYRMETPAPIEDVAAAVQATVRREEIAALVRPGARIAIGVGSRGVARLGEMVRALVAALRDLGADPFVIPAMGSHGGATAEGQREVIARLGVDEASVGAPVIASMETEEIGRTADGIAVRLDRAALGADGIVFVARVKPHTAFRGAYESGLAKMIAIGLGKQSGAAACHAAGFGDMARRVPLLAEVALARAPILFGLAAIENAYDRPFHIEAVPAQAILAAEPKLLDRARAAMARVPFAQLDVMVIDRIGKNISGDGADPNITGKYPTPFATGGPRVTKQVALDLTDETEGNANGIGTADLTTARAVAKMSLAQTYPNGLTSTVVGPTAIPMILPDDRLAFQAAILTCNPVGAEPRVMRIADTLTLGEFMVSGSVLEDVARDRALTIIQAPRPLAFGADGSLLDLGSPGRIPVGARGG